jgi:transcriptional regulator with XRE-family HTH domain
MSAAALGDQIGVSQSTISRFETGRMLPSVAIVRRMLEVLAVPHDEAAEIEDLARTLATEFNSWRVVMRKSFADHQADYAAREAAATRISCYESAVLPGLLQLPDYTRHVLSRVGVPVDTGPEAIAARMQRQTILYEPARHFDFFITEAALRAQVCPPDVLRAQWDRLLIAGSMENVSVRVLPTAAQREVVAFNSFTMFDDDLVVVETQTAETVVRDADDIAVYASVGAELDRVALTPVATATLIRQLLAGEREMTIEGRAKPAPIQGD